MAKPQPAKSSMTAEHPPYLDDEDGTSYVRYDVVSNPIDACRYVEDFTGCDGELSCKGLVAMRPHVHDDKCGGLIPDPLPCIEKCGACGSSVGRYTHSSYWRCDNGHTIYRADEAEVPLLGCSKSDDGWYDEAGPGAKDVSHYWKVVWE